MDRFVPTLPQWPCCACRAMMTRNTAYYIVDAYGVVGIKRKVNGAYCRACASAEALQQVPASRPPRQTEEDAC